jgi:hypothetical protein
MLARVRDIAARAIGLAEFQNRWLQPRLADATMMQRLAFHVARGALAQATRDIVPEDPTAWEFSAFSQNGEDGIVDYSLAQLLTPERTFAEIGASDGLENNSSYLAFVKKYSGIMIDGNPALIARARRVLQPLNHGVVYHSEFVEPATAAALLARFPSATPDFFSLDIDGVDYYVAEALWDAGLRPAMVCVEYNSLMGPTRPVTIPYAKGFSRMTAHASRQYYGVALAAWHHFWTGRGYRFLTVDTNGVNALYVEPSRFRPGCFDGVRPLEFCVNFTQRQMQRDGLGDELSRLAWVDVTQR